MVFLKDFVVYCFKKKKTHTWPSDNVRRFTSFFFDKLQMRR